MSSSYDDFEIRHFFLMFVYIILMQT